MSNSLQRRRFRRVALTLAAGGVNFGWIVNASAQTDNWIAASSDWNTASNWSLNAVPVAGDIVNVIDADSLDRTITYDYNGPAAALGRLMLNNTGGGTNSLSLGTVGLALTAGSELIGGLLGSPSGGMGAMTQSAGTNTLTDELTLGYNSTDVGSYNLTGGILASSGDEYVGVSGTGTFSQSGGSNVLGSSGLLHIGYLAGSSGSYTLSGGSSLSTSGSEIIGENGAGSFTQINGVNTANSLVIGAATASNGNYSLSGGTLIGPITVGGGGTGVLSVSGGLLNCPATLTVVNGPGNMLNLSGGTISTEALDLSGNPSLLNWTGGTLNFTTSVTFDSAAPATSTSASLGSGVALGGGQSLVINGNETLGGTGPFSLTLNGGSSNIVSGSITLPATGSITQFTGSTLYYASFTQAGGSIGGTFVNETTFNYQSGAFNGRLVNQGLFNFGSTFTAGSGIENDTSMTVSAGQTLTLNGQGLDNLGTFHLAGGTINGGAVVINDYSGVMTAYGSINQLVTNDGSFTLVGLLTQNSTFTNNGTLNIPSTTEIRNGSITNNGTINLSGGAVSLTVNNTDTGVITGYGEITGMNTNAGQIDIAGNSDVPGLTVVNGWTNTGTVTLEGSGATINGAFFTNEQNGIIQGVGQINPGVTNFGIIQVSGGQLIMAGLEDSNSSSTSQIDIGPGGTLTYLKGLTTTSGLIAMSGGAFNDNGASLINEPGGNIAGYGTISASTLTNDGTFTFGGTASSIFANLVNQTTLTLAGANSVFGNVTNNFSAAISLAGTSPNVIYGATSNNGTLIVNPGATGWLYGPYTGSGPIRNNGSLYVNANSVSGTVTGSGTLTVGAVGTPTNFQSLAGGGGITQGALMITAGSTLDITNAPLTINYGSAADPAATIRSYLISGYNATGNKWTGTGITSSLAAANPTEFSVGYADGGNPVDRANTGVPAGEVEVKYTVAGDANLSGAVDLSDLVIVASDFGQSGADWAQGDVNYDGNVDLSDLVIVASNFGASLSSVQASDFSGSFAAEWQLALAEVHGADVSIPEPCMTGLAVAAPLLMRRRRS
jgi:fibronectin-binding autotransporter adhesin